MKPTLEKIEKNILILQYDFIEEVIRTIWGKNPDDYGIELVNMYLIEFSDYYVNFSDFISIATFKISESIAYEFWDDLCGNFETKRMKKFKKYCKEIRRDKNLAFFNTYYKENLQISKK